MRDTHGERRAGPPRGRARCHAATTLASLWTGHRSRRGRCPSASSAVAIFHALRATFISWLGMTGVHPRMAQALARHASIETTLGTYTDLRLFDSKGAVANLPLPETARPESSAASA